MFYLHNKITGLFPFLLLGYLYYFHLHRNKRPHKNNKLI
jgi:hypothetical protein